MDIETLRRDPWFIPLHTRAEREGFPDHIRMPDGLSGWFIDPEHLIQHIYSQGIHLRWAYEAHDIQARPILDMSTSLIDYCGDTLTSQSAFIGSFCTDKATFLMMTTATHPYDNRDFLSFSFCIPGDALHSGLPTLQTQCRSDPWISTEGMVDCITIEDPNEGQALLTIGTRGIDRDMSAIFKPNQSRFVLARTWHDKQMLGKLTQHPRCVQDKSIQRL